MAKPERIKACDCSQCVLHRRYYAAVKERDFDALAELAHDALDELANVGAEGDYLRVISDGSWPSAVEHLEKWLARAKAQRELKHVPHPQ